MSGLWIVAVDLGNTALKFALARERQSDTSPCDGQPELSGRVALSEIDWPDQLADALQPVLTEVSAQWRVASVNRPAFDRLRAWATRARERDVLRAIGYRDVPLRTDVREPQRLGIDRLIGAWGATLCGQRQPVVVVDAGSALTIDLVDEAGTFRGGAILPGMRLQLRSLASGTDALPEVEMEALGQQIVPGRITDEAIRLGVTASMVGAIEFLTQRYQRLLQQTPALVVTGGDAPQLLPWLPQHTVHAADLIQRGLLSLPLK